MQSISIQNLLNPAESNDITNTKVTHVIDYDEMLLEKFPVQNGKEREHTSSLSVESQT